MEAIVLIGVLALALAFMASMDHAEEGERPLIGEWRRGMPNDDQAWVCLHDGSVVGVVRERDWLLFYEGPLITPYRECTSEMVFAWQPWSVKSWTNPLRAASSPR